MPDINKLIEQLTDAQQQLELLSQIVSDALDEARGGAYVEKKTTPGITRKAIIAYLRKVKRPASIDELIENLSQDLRKQGLKQPEIQIWKSIKKHCDEGIPIPVFALMKKDEDGRIVPVQDFNDRTGEDIQSGTFPYNTVGLIGWLKRPPE